MSVATKNPFALLGDEDDSSTPAAPAKPAASAAAPAAGAATRGAQKSKGPAARGGKYYPRGGRSGPRDSNQPQAEEPVGDNQRKSEGRGRGRGGGRGGPGRGGRRPFDRHSQTGKTDSDKKVHQGWGGDEGNTELKAEEAAATDAAAEAAPETPAEGADPSAEAAPEARPRREREPEEEDNTLTLDQYLAQQKEKDAILPKLEGSRQANDGADDVWKGAVPLSKNEDEESYFVGKGKSAPKARAKKEEKVFIEIDGRFERPERGGRGRGRGGDRARGAGRGRGGPRGGQRQQNGSTNLNVDDETAFPSLA